MTVFGISCIRLLYERDDGNRRDDVVVEHRLTAHALHVDDRRFAGDRDRLLERADPEIGVHRGGERAGELDAFAPDGLKPVSVKVTV